MSRIKFGPKIGEGGMGKVFLATYVVDPATNKTMSAAVKKITPSKMNLDEIVLQAQLSRLPHCNRHIACFYDIFTDPVTHDYQIVMEYIKGEEMWDHVRQHVGRFTDRELRNIMRQTLEGMVFIHDHNIAHGDIKMENFMMDGSGKIKFIDFGFGCNEQSCANIRVWHGTRFLAPPEASVRLRPKDLAAMKKADLWALGAMFVELAAYDGSLRRVDDLGLDGPKLHANPKLRPSDRFAWRDKTIRKVIDGLMNANPRKRISAKNALKMLQRGEKKK